MRDKKINEWIIDDILITRKAFIFYLIVVSCLYIFFIQKYCIDNYLYNYAISDLLIHYNGEFSRRGLLGTFLLAISDFLNIKLRFVIEYFFYFIYLMYFTIYYFFLKKIIYRNKFLFLFVIFSPLGILYPLYELESLLRKEIFLYTFFLIFLILLEKNYKEKIYYCYLNLVLPILILIHDGFIFFIAIFFLSWAIQKFKNKSFLKLKDIIISSLTLLIIVLLHLKFISIGNSTGYVDQVVINLSNYDYKIQKFGAFIWLERDLFYSLSMIYENINLNRIIRFLILLLLTFLPLIFFFKKIHFFVREISVIFILTLLSFFLIFFVALDWGRFLTVIFNLLILMIVFSVKINQNFIDLKIKNFSLMLLFLFFYCSIWNPKTTFLEKVNFLPQKDVIQRIILYK